MKLLDPTHLSRGSEQQVKAFEVIERSDLFEKLSNYSPVLAGTFPLDLIVDGSDLDIICASENLEEFAAHIEATFSSEKSFKLEHTMSRNLPTVFAKFVIEDLPVEIFCQNKSVLSQPAVLHMLVEARLLSFAPKEAKDEIRELKAQGLKTEPAFAKCFEIDGDPYDQLLSIAHYPDHKILDITHIYRFR